MVSNLARCLTCVDEFADFCIPLAIQKLESSLEVAKLDSLYLLVNNCNIFINILLWNMTFFNSTSIKIHKFSHKCFHKVNEGL